MRWTLPALLLAAAAAPAVELKSVSALAVAPNGTLFVADPQAGVIYQVFPFLGNPLGNGEVTVPDLSANLAKLFGTPDVAVVDLKADPLSGYLYLAVRAGKGKDEKPALCRMTRTGELTTFALPETAKACKLPNASDKQRRDAITAMAVAGDKLLVAGLSNEEFASTFRVLPLPLPAEAAPGTGIEVYHAAHGKKETHAPIKAFVPYTAGGVEYVMAAYTCTPLVRLKASDLTGKKLTGVTIAELGNRNVPLDLIAYSKGGKEFLLMANSARGVMKIPADPVAAAEGLTQKVNGGGTAGVPFEPVTQLQGVVQLDKLDADHAVAVILTGKVLSVRTVPLP